MTIPTRRVLYALIVVIALQLAVAVNGIWYANKVARDSEEKWCAIITSLDDAYRQQPPSTDTGRRIAAEMHELRASLKCEVDR
jgi:hypothetical protein